MSVRARGRRGRKPLKTKHVDALEGSASAKLRMQVLLATLEGELTIAEGCQRLGIGESRLHKLRHDWLQEALQLLEPRPTGRKPKASSDDDRSQELAARLKEAEQRLALAEARRELETALPSLGKKKNSPKSYH